MVRMVSSVESDWGFRPFEIFGSSWSDSVDLPSDQLLLSLGLVRIRPSVYHVELMFWVREHLATCLRAGVPIGPILVARWALRVLLHVVPQGVAILCGVFPFGVLVPKGFIFLLCNLIKIPLNPRFRECPLVVVDEFGTEISPGINGIRWKSHEPILYNRR